MSPIPISEPASIVLEEPPGAVEAVAQAAGESELADVAAQFPASPTAWAALGDSALGRGRVIEAYAYFRVGYHRGLDGVRKAGWKGSGKVLWAEESNRGFLRSLKGLGAAASEIGESHEAERCEQFLRELSPDAP